MHRSGTSAITRGLEVLGVKLGNNLVPAAIDNPKGFWEDKEFLGINEELLAYLGAGSDRLGLIDWKLPETAAVASLKVRAEKIVGEKCSQNAVWAFKDPRTARLLPFWQPVFESVDCELCYVIVTRNPLSIVKSLYERNGFESEKTFYLWLEHIIPAISRSAGATRVVIDYDKLLENPEAQLLRLSRALGLSAPEPLALADYQTDFLENKLRHTLFTMDDLKYYPSVPSQVITAYEWLVSLSNEEAPFSLYCAKVEGAFESLAQELNDFSNEYWKSSLADQISAIKIREQIIGERDETIQAQTRLIDERDETIQAQTRLIDERDETIQVKTRLIDDGVAGMSEMEKMIQDRDETIQAQTTLIDSGVAGMNSMEKIILDRDRAISAYELELGKLNTNIFIRALRIMKLIN